MRGGGGLKSSGIGSTQYQTYPTQVPGHPKPRRLTGGKLTGEQACKKKKLQITQAFHTQLGTLSRSLFPSRDDYPDIVSSDLSMHSVGLCIMGVFLVLQS